MKKLVFGSIFILLLIGCSTDDSPNSNNNNNNPPVEVFVDLSNDLESSSLSTEGIGDISAALNFASSHSRISSLLILRNGKLVSENYFNGATANDLQDVRSITKSVVSILIGKALQNGDIFSIDDPINNYLSNSGYTLSEEQQAITFRHLLSMSGGFEWNEVGVEEYGNWVTSQEPVQYLLNRSIVNTPGTTFNYNSASTHLLGETLVNASGMSLEAFANQNLFNALNITNYQWEQLSDASLNGGAGIDLRPRDLAKIGQLFLQNGRSGDDQIIPQSWINSSTSPQYSWRNNIGAFTNYSYAHLWWTRDGTANYGASYLAWGYGGQFIYVVPSKDLVIVTTSNWVLLSQEPGGANQVYLDFFNMLINDILTQVI